MLSFPEGPAFREQTAFRLHVFGSQALAIGNVHAHFRQVHASATVFDFTFQESKISNPRSLNLRFQEPAQDFTPFLILHSRNKLSSLNPRSARSRAKRRPPVQSIDRIPSAGAMRRRCAGDACCFSTSTFRRDTFQHPPTNDAAAIPSCEVSRFTKPLTLLSSHGSSPLKHPDHTGAGAVLDRTQHRATSSGRGLHAHRGAFDR